MDTIHTAALVARIDHCLGRTKTLLETSLVDDGGTRGWRQYLADL